MSLPWPQTGKAYEVTVTETYLPWRMEIAIAKGGSPYADALHARGAAPILNNAGGVAFGQTLVGTEGTVQSFPRKGGFRMPATRDRVPAHTSNPVNEKIRQEAERRLEYFDNHPEEIPRRLNELNEEWDIERAIEANAATIAFLGVALGARDRRWLVLPAAVTAFLFQHAIQGWCPPVPILRRLGFRTTYEIEEERRALQALRGDFDKLPSGKGRGRAALQVARSA